MGCEDVADTVARWDTDSPTRSPEAMAAEAEMPKDVQAVQVTVGVCAGTQSMGQVYYHRKGVMYIPLDGKEEIFSAAQQKKVKNVQYDIMTETPEQINDGHRGKGDELEATQAGGGEDEAGGGVAQPTLQHLLQVGADQQGASVQACEESTEETDEGHEEGQAGK